MVGKTNKHNQFQIFKNPLKITEIFNSSIHAYKVTGIVRKDTFFFTKYPRINLEILKTIISINSVKIKC